MERGAPSPDQIKDIFKYIYLWFEKYKNSETDDFVNMIDEAKQIRDRYNFEFTEKLIVGLGKIIEEYHRERKRNGL